MDEFKRNNWKSYLSVVYIATLAITWCFIYQKRGDGFDLPRLIYQGSAWFSFAAIVLLPLGLPLLLSLSKRLMKKNSWQLLIVFTAGTLAAVIHLLLLLDLMILFNFGYHINGLVINLLTVPGGYESMGIDDVTFSIAMAGIVLVALMDNALAYEMIYRRRPCFFKGSGRGFIWLASSFIAICLTVSLMSTGLADFKVNVPVLSAMDTFPAYPQVRMRTILRFFKVEEPKRDEIVGLGGKYMRGSSLAYPKETIVRDSAHGKCNVIWLVGESLRADLFSQRIMPNLMGLSQNGWRFSQHYSGGHGTRPGMFSMFYGLYGNYWDAFLHRSRQPLFFDWLREDGYIFKCQTAAKFSYPEFDRTIFSGMKSEELLEVSGGEAWRRDEMMTDQAIDFVNSQNGDNPFFLFCFYESTHAPYSFSEDKALESDYLRKFNYVTVAAKDAKELYNRDVNAANHIDRQIGRLMATLGQRREIMENTIIIVTGDHGEEFYEKGRLGHNSSFVREQINVPLVIVAPGLSPNVYEGISHHTDIIPTLAPYFGVSSPAEAYSVGGNLFDEGYARTSFVSTGWDMATLVTLTHKLMLPIGRRHLYHRNTITTFDDAECPEYQSGFYRDYAGELAKAQDDMYRFMRNER